MKSVIKAKTYFAVILFFNCIIFYGCGESDREENTDNVDKDLNIIYKELAGTYKLLKSEVTFKNQPKKILESSDDVFGTIYITLDRRMYQRIHLQGLTLESSGVYEIIPDENIMLIRDEPNGNIISKSDYTWNGEILTTTTKRQDFIEKDSWQKISEWLPPQYDPGWDK